MMTKTSPSLEAELQQLTARALSPLSRYGHVALLLAALLMSVLIAALLATESTLPPRTHVAFAVMLAIGISWVAYATWVLTQRRPLMAKHRVIAGWMAVAFTGVFLGGALAMALSTPQTMHSTAAVSGGGMFVLAIVALVQARRRVAALQERKRELEDRLGQ
jgi:ABC-type iron transport system FetAB permease component